MCSSRGRKWLACKTHIHALNCTEMVISAAHGLFHFTSPTSSIAGFSCLVAWQPFSVHKNDCNGAMAGNNITVLELRFSQR
jgi:hypothetical protein